MAAGWPTKVTYADGDVFSAADINDTNGTLNYINPTSATDNQVLTRDNVASGKVKWANSPANTLTTTGDLYYASAANTPARLGIGSTAQVLTVTGGVPTWATASAGAMTLITTNTITAGTTSSFSSIPQTYKTIKVIGKFYANTTATYTFEPNAALTSAATRRASISVTPAWVLAASTSVAYVGESGNGEDTAWEMNISGYTVVATTHNYSSFGVSTSTPYIAGGRLGHASAAITSLTFNFASSTGTIQLYGLS